MIRKVSFESYERRIKQVLAALKENGIESIEEANEICEKAGVDPYQMCEDTQGICFENAKWAYVCGAAIAIKKGVKSAAEAAEAIGIGLQSFCRASASLVVLPTTVRWVSDTETWQPVCSARRQSVLLSWPDTRASPLLRVPSRLPRKPIRYVRSLCALSSMVLARTPL